MANTHSIDLELSSSQYLSISDAAQTGLDITGDISFEAWIKLESLPSNNGNANYTLISKDETGSLRSYGIQITKYNTVFNDQITFNWFSGGELNRWVMNEPFDSDDIGEWIHIACALDVSAETVYFYKNGVSKSGTHYNDKNGTSIDDTSAKFAIGGRSDGTNFFDGLMDDVRVWNDIRTSTEIADNYDTELVGNESNLVAYWKLNNSLLDETSNDNDLTNNNSATFSTDVPFVGKVFLSVSDSPELSDSADTSRARNFSLSDSQELSDFIETLRTRNFLLSDPAILNDYYGIFRQRNFSLSDSAELDDYTEVLRARNFTSASVVDSYNESNKNSDIPLYPSVLDGVGQTFLGNGKTLSKTTFYLQKVGSPTGNIYTQIYATDVNGKPTGSALATSDNIDVSTLSSSYRLIDFAFSGDDKIKLNDNVLYCVAIFPIGDSSNYFNVGRNDTEATENGKSLVKDSLWLFAGGALCFYVYTEEYAVSDSIFSSDTISIFRGFFSNISDSLSISETISSLRALIASAVDSLQIYENFIIFITKFISVLDTISLSDILKSIFSHKNKSPKIINIKRK